MPSFTTPEPITATIDVVVGDVRIRAAERDSTVVEVQPRDPSDAEDRKVAELTRVEYAGGHLLVKAPKLRSWLSRSAGGAVDVTIDLPAGSRVQGGAQIADFHTDGPLGDCRITTGLGRIQVGDAGTVRLKTGSGDISVERSGGTAEIASASGDVRLGELTGSATIKTSNGDTWVGAAAGELRLSAANGDIAVDSAQGSVTAKTANGTVRVHDVARGSVVLATHSGDLEVGIREGTAAWLDVNALAGRVHNALESSAAPDAPGDTVEVRARTAAGDVVIRRA